MMNPKLVWRKGEGAPSGTDLFFDRRLCFQARDLYYSCLKKQNTEGNIKLTKDPNKYLCFDNLINYETYCPPDFIYNTKQRYRLDQRNKKVWTQEDLDLINFRRNNFTAMERLPNNAMYEDDMLNKRGLIILKVGFASN